jgi:small subunit ribosomal protein S3
MKKAEAHVQLKPGIIGVRVKIMPPDAYFPDRIKILEAAPEEEKITVSEQAEAKPQEQPPTQTDETSKPEPEEQPEVQATEIADEPKKEAEK